MSEHGSFERANSRRNKMDEDLMCPAFWDGDGWHCPLVGSEDCDWDCDMPPEVFESPPENCDNE
jgi:hypothetical protein